MDSQITTHASSYAYTSNNYPAFYDAWVQHLFGSVSNDTTAYLSRLPPSTSPIIVDLCTGTGRVLKDFVPHLRSLDSSVKLYGIDHSAAMLARAAQTFPAGEELVQPVWRAASATNFSDMLEEGDRGRVDLIVFSAGSIAHLTEREEVRLFLREVESVLKPREGVAVVSVLAECIPITHNEDKAEPEYEAPLNLPCKEPGQEGWWIKSPTVVTWNAARDVRTDSFSVEFYSADGGERVWREELKWSLVMFDEEGFRQDVEGAGLVVDEVVGEGEGYERFYVLKTKV